MAIVARNENYIVPASQNFANVNYPIVYRPTVAVNGVPYPDNLVLNYNQTPFGNPAAVYWYGPAAGADPADLSFAKNQVVKGSGNWAPGDNILVVYFGDGTSVVTAGNPLQPIQPTGSVPLPGESFGTCGSGKYEAVEEINDVATLAELQQIADGLLARSGVIPKLLEFETDRPGLRPGQLMTVNLPAFDLSGQFLITNVSMRENDGVRKFGSRFTSIVKLSSTKDLGDWVKWFERLIARTKKPKPVEQEEVATFVLAPGASLSSGIAITNTYSIKRDGQLLDFTLQAETPPIGEILKVDLILSPADGSSEFSIFPAAKPSISPGHRELLKFTTFARQPLFVTAGSLLRCSVTYQVIAPDYTPAQSVTAVLRISV